MIYETGEKIALLDSVIVTEIGVRGSVVGFDMVGGREFVQVQKESGAKVWASANGLKKFRKLIVQKEV